MRWVKWEKTRTEGLLFLRIKNWNVNLGRTTQRKLFLSREDDERQAIGSEMMQKGVEDIGTEIGERRGPHGDPEPICSIPITTMLQACFGRNMTVTLWKGGGTHTSEGTLA